MFFKKFVFRWLFMPFAYPFFRHKALPTRFAWDMAVQHTAITANPFSKCIIVWLRSDSELFVLPTNCYGVVNRNIVEFAQ